MCDHILILGASGGIGHAAIQVSKYVGSKISGVVSSPKKKKFILDSGANFSFDRTEAGWLERIQNETGGVDVVLEIMGGEFLSKFLELLRTEGRLCQIAVMEGSVSSINLTKILSKRLSVYGAVMRSRQTSEKSKILNHLASEFLPWFLEKKIQIPITSIFPPDELEIAFSKMRSNSHIGKMILRL